MRILHIIDSISPEAGGTTEAVRMLIRYAPSGYSNELATLDEPTAPYLAALPFPVHALGTGGWYSSRLVSWLKANRERFDGVIVHGLWKYNGLAAWRAFAGTKPYVLFPHGMLDPYFKRAFPAKHLKKSAYWLFIESWVLRGAFRVLFTTAAERDLARDTFWPSQWEPMVVALGAEAPPYEATISIPEFFSLCPEVVDRRFLLFLGRIDRKKGCDLLINAFAALRDHDPDLHLVMAGPDASGWGAELQAAAEHGGIASRVHWPGMLEGRAKWGAIEACEAFILPSHQENFGIAVVEALACGRPVLISNQINIATDVLSDGCALVESDTLTGTQNLLTRWFSLSPLARETMSAQARHSFASRYDMRRNTETIFRVFELAPQANSKTKTLAEAR
jgi:glycosyltransferase involved in cell wall biosynthesis